MADVKVKCNCGIRRTTKVLIQEAPKVVELRCGACGRVFRATVTKEQVREARADAAEQADVERRLADGTLRRTPPPSQVKRPKRAPVTRVEPTAPKRRNNSDQVTGAPKLFHYAVYVRHPWGTDRLVIGVKVRKVQAARDEAWDRVSRTRKTADLKIMDCVPMKWVAGEGMVETRRTRVKTGQFKFARRPKSRASVRQRKAPKFQSRIKKND